jgi:DHHC palmitoyltransferase
VVHCSVCNACKPDADHHSPLAGRCVSKHSRGLFQCAMWLLSIALLYLAGYWTYVSVQILKYEMQAEQIPLVVSVAHLVVIVCFGLYCLRQLADGCIACCKDQTVQHLRLQREARDKADSILRRNQAEQIQVIQPKENENLIKPQLVSELPESRQSRPDLPNGSWIIHDGSQNSLKNIVKSTDRISLPQELDDRQLNPLVKFNNMKSRQLQQPATFTLIPENLGRESMSHIKRQAKPKSKTVK